MRWIVELVMEVEMDGTPYEVRRYPSFTRKEEVEGYYDKVWRAVNHSGPLRIATGQSIIVKRALLYEVNAGSPYEATEIVRAGNGTVLADTDNPWLGLDLGFFDGLFK